MIKRYTCVDSQSGMSLVDDGYVLGMLGPRAVREDSDGAWVKFEDAAAELIKADQRTQRMLERAQCAERQVVNAARALGYVDDKDG
jgi:hypothetical protein